MMVDHPPATPPRSADRPAPDVAGATVRRPGRAEVDPRRHQRRRRLTDQALSWGTPLALCLLWQLAATRAWIDVRYFPAPSTIWHAQVDSFDDGSMLDALGVTTRKLVIGFLAGTVAGWLVGALIGSVRVARAALEPLLIALYTIPKLAIFPIFLLVFGLGETPHIVMVAVSVFFVVVIGVSGAIRSIDQGYIDAARAFDATAWQRLRHVIVPAALPAVASSLRVAAGTAVLVVVGLELVTGGKGLGFLIWNSWNLFLPARMYAGAIVASLLGLAFTLIVTALSNRLSPWATHDDLFGR